MNDDKYRKTFFFWKDIDFHGAERFVSRCYSSFFFLRMANVLKLGQKWCFNFGRLLLFFFNLFITMFLVVTKVEGLLARRV